MIVYVGKKHKYVHIDYWDTWSMDITLAPIIHPMLIQLKKTQHGAPCTDDDDVPEELRSTSARPKENEWDTDEFYFERWDWILDEMIFAFDQKTKDKWEDNNEELHKRISNGFRLFGKYYENLWD
jgi:hypothetical protein